MAKSPKKHIFGIHSALFYRRDTGVPYGLPLEIIGNSNLNFTAEFEDLNGGSEKFIVASEATLINSDVTMSTKEYPDWLFEVTTGATTTQVGAELLGNVSALVNKGGATIQDAINGISAIAALAGSEANLKFGKYVIEGRAAGDINITFYSNIDSQTGTPVSYQNDDGDLLAADLTIVVGANTIPSLGLELTGIGVPAFGVGDTATFEVRPINNGSSLIQLGKGQSNIPEVGVIFYAQRRSNGEMVEIECPRAIAGGIPVNLEEKTWSTGEVQVKVLKDFDKDVVAEIRTVR